MTWKTLVAGGLLAAAAAALPAQAQSQLSFRLAPVATEQFHADAGSEQVWSDANYEALLAGIRNMEAHGLNPDHYGLERLEALKDDLDARDRVATAAWLTAAAHLLYGKLDPLSVEPTWTVASRRADFATVLQYALVHGTIAESLEEFAPRQPFYQSMKAELAAQHALSEDPITHVPDGVVLKSGQSGDRVTALQARLVELGYMGPDSVSGSMDAATIDALKVFQTAEELDADGVAGASTIRTLNRGPENRINQLRANLERWRWLPEDLGRRHVRVNIASFEVTTYTYGLPQKTHLAIIGKTYRKTPVFSDRIEYIVFNPWWETPSSLARADKLPMFRKDPGAVQRLGFQVLDRSGAVVDASAIDWNAVSAADFPYRIRQAPGPMNALGQVKIMFPNPHNVYLHDTPARDLFSQRQRAFSSGCVRTQDPIGLAKWLLEETADWPVEAVDRAVASGRETRANLSQSVPVHVLYITATADGVGGVRYLDDIYGRDGAVLAGLRVAPAPS